MFFSSEDNLEIGSITGLNLGRLFFRGFRSIDGDTVMDNTLIIEYRDGSFRLDRVIGEECPAIRQMHNGDLWCLGFFGNVYIRRGPSWVDLQVERGQENDMAGIWEFDGAVWASGWGSTVLKFENDAWIDVAPDFHEDLYVFGLLARGSELLAVGEEGLFLSIRGDEVSRIDLPTNHALKGIASLPDGRLIVCGDRGTLLVGSEDRWTDHSRPDMDVNFYQVISWRGCTFVSAETHILDFRDGELEPVAEVTSFELVEAGERLWSVGSKELNYLADDKWEPFVVEIEIEDEGPKEATPIS